MKLQTEISIPALAPPLRYDEASLLLGSCFSEAIGRRMQRLRFDCTVNPFGILFNPQSVLQALARLAEFRPFGAGELQETPGGAYCSWMHHGRFAASCPDEALRLMNGEYRPAAERFAHLRTLLLTWGTSYLYILRSSGEVVANCHKFPASLFLRRRMTVEEIVEGYAAFLERWFAESGDGGGRRVVLTVSPVRHLRDGLHENQLSKSILLLAADELAGRFPGRIAYFPAYELLLDELRDYRFYARDLLHPSEVAEDYVFERFAEACFAPDTRRAMQDIGEWVQMAEHRPLHPFGKSYAAFRENMQRKKEKLLAQYPFLSGRL